ncbi:MAG: dihydrodipicolinate synthase family protein [SAR202 cluster bacterium]|jgi:4-hydroxy-tetrahydrodipicolinate synthase|nr:dihydrodipicolinate synthase family protein [SAR202 cluster bacterium]MDP6513657.1 dihydrodipicolinate synthase family protein [SAR202 cluster bacterium]MDP6714075.1 dihydrodipicolinate synthase family protein [SAR202 cluster bacterium]
MTSKQKEYRGVYSIPVTPFEEDGSLDRDSLRRCVSFCIEAGAHGIVMPVNASEGPRLTDAERDEVTSIGIRTVDGAVPFIGGVSGISLHHCVERAKVASDAGVDGVMAMPPNGMSGEQEMMDFYGALAEAADVPVWIQNNKPPAGPTIPTGALIKIVNEIPGADYLKEESLIPGHVISAVLEACGDICKGIMGGMGGRYLLDEYRRGGCGTMPAGHITEAHVAVWDALERGGTDDKGRQVVTDEARDLFDQILPALNFESLFGATVYKQAFWRRGIIKTPTVRSPGRRAFDKRDGEELDKILDRLKPLLSAS